MPGYYKTKETSLFDQTIIGTAVGGLDSWPSQQISGTVQPMTELCRS